MKFSGVVGNVKALAGTMNASPGTVLTFPKTSTFIGMGMIFLISVRLSVANPFT